MPDAMSDRPLTTGEGATTRENVNWLLAECGRLRATLSQERIFWIEEEAKLEAERDALREQLAAAAKPLSRLKLAHSAACPFMFDGDCACGVEAIEALARAALGVEGPAE